MSPKVFVSYSWTSPAHQARVRAWSEGLISDGVEVILDQFDLDMAGWTGWRWIANAQEWFP
jgi:hypothetical protein